MTSERFLWFRSWHGAPMDHKWAVIAARSGVKTGIVSAIVWALYDYASQQPERGVVSDFDVETYSVYSGFSEDEINTVISALNDKGVIEDGKLTAWEKWQPQREDNSTERVKAWRNKQSSDVTNETQCNAMKRNETHGNAPDREIEKEKEEDREKESACAQSIPAIQLMLEKVTGIMPSGMGDVKAMDEIEAMQPIQEDVQAAYDWYVGQGKKFRYYSSLVGPVRTAIANRVQSKQTIPKGNSTAAIQARNKQVIEELWEETKDGNT